MDEGQKHRLELEADTLRMFAIFFLVLAALVLFGTVYATDRTATMVISLASAAALAAVSFVSAFFSRRVRRQLQTLDTQT